MCGINGFNWNDKRLVKQMNNSLIHRGPDAEGIYLEEKLSFGHRRLSIIDLTEKGKQPMVYSHKEKKVVIVYNGEVYNFLELRKELKKKGYKFKSNTDTEVILASYLEEGYDCVKKFNGMWAFCIYDTGKNLLFLSRDRIGKKPLYYYSKNKKFIFSSEIKGILRHKIKKTIDKKSVNLYFSLESIPAPYSIYEEIKKLEAGTNLFFNLTTGILKKKRYYNYPSYSPIRDKKKLIQEGKKLLNDSVKKRLISDVPLGAFLSGGIDSSAIVGEMVNQIKRENLNTFSIGFKIKELDETKFMKVCEKKFQTKQHHKYFEKKEFEDFLKNSYYYYDEPFANASMFPTMFLSKMAKSKITVALSGDGADEIFGGYSRYNIAAKIILLKKIPKRFRRLLVKILPNSKVRQGIKASLLPLEKIYSESREEIYKPKVYKEFVDKKMTECLRLSKGNLIEAFILMDRYYLLLPDCYLVKVDRASMSNSLEVRSPFLDYRFFEYAAKIPSDWKANFFKTKILMRQIVKEIVPREILYRKKSGFSPPIGVWLLEKEYQNELKQQMKELYEEKILDINWKKFFEKKIFCKKDITGIAYRIRLFLFYKWYKFWVKNK